MKPTRKEMALSFLQFIVAGKIREAYDKYVSTNFRHHNAWFRGDRESLLLAMEESHVQSPNKIFEVKRALEDGDLVAVHSHFRRDQNDSGHAVVHIFRFESDRVVELWDLGQAVNKDSPNENGMF